MDTKNPCAINTNANHVLAGPCTPLYTRKIRVTDAPQSCVQCIYSEIEEANGGVNNCLELCIDRQEKKGACRDPWANKDERYVPTRKEWCTLARCVEEQRMLDTLEHKCKNPCRDLDRVLFNNNSLSSYDYCM